MGALGGRGARADARRVSGGYGLEGADAAVLCRGGSAGDGGRVALMEAAGVCGDDGVVLGDLRGGGAGVRRGNAVAVPARVRVVKGRAQELAGLDREIHEPARLT